MVPDISGFHGVFVVGHVLGVLLFVLAHGVSAAVLWRVRYERDPAALRTLLDLSRRSYGLAVVGFLVWFLAGIVAGFSGNWWTSGRYWIWASLVIAIVVTAVMTPFGRIYFNRIRESLGIDAKTGAIDPAFQVDRESLDGVISSGQPQLLVVFGVGGLAVMAWLMIAKPF